MHFVGFDIQFLTDLESKKNLFSDYTVSKLSLGVMDGPFSVVGFDSKIPNTPRIYQLVPGVAQSQSGEKVKPKYGNFACLLIGIHQHFNFQITKIYLTK